MWRKVLDFDSIEILTLVHYSCKLLPKCKVTESPGQNAMGNLRVGGMRRQPGKLISQRTQCGKHFPYTVDAAATSTPHIPTTDLSMLLQ